MMLQPAVAEHFSSSQAAAHNHPLRLPRNIKQAYSRNRDGSLHSLPPAPPVASRGVPRIADLNTDALRSCDCQSFSCGEMIALSHLQSHSRSQSARASLIRLAVAICTPMLEMESANSNVSLYLTTYLSFILSRGAEGERIAAGTDSINATCRVASAFRAE
ncbi:hypothetical protein DAEQUDRAFT_369620 [Daedalea quercina L-15889]|uniref:Uncharacterized protein n=1 Tax=Daedalea quercina L-15889 TaxID=1314783 RepID=A0A165PAR9_9APHY|nr:hypothetical protein DAEQUDRAFT_369620 [Daedalea quercina L-15889]